MKFKVEIYSEVKTFERNLVTFEAETLEEAKKILEKSSNEWVKHYDDLTTIEYLNECTEDTGYYEIQYETLEEVDE